MKRLRTIVSLLLLLLTAEFAFGQPGATLVGLSYRVPYQLNVTPGQIVTFNVTGVHRTLSAPVRANQTPLPTLLAGISVTLNQSAAGQSSSLPVPLLSVQQTNRCADIAGFTADCYITMITGQIPFEMTVVSGGSPSTNVVISEDGVRSQQFDIRPTLESIHVVAGSDSFANSCSGACVTHANGSLVTMESPALPGEVVVVYAYGLGKTSPAVRTGELTPAPAPVVTTPPYLQFDFTPNAGPRQPSRLNATSSGVSLPVFAGLTPGAVGLYQINVKLPDTFPAVPPCSTSPLGLFTIYSNLTIDVSDGNGSSDAAPICVQP